MLFATLALVASATVASALPVAQNSTLTKRGPSNNWGVSLSGFTRVPNTAGNPAYHVFPDSALTSLPAAGGGFQVYWSNAENYRSAGSGPLPEQQQRIEPYTPYPNIYFGGRTGQPGWANGGKWLTAVHPHPNGNPAHLVAFYHAEDGYWPYQGAGGPAWKSVGSAVSYDNGMTWQDRGQILTSSGRPSDEVAIRNGVYGGIGNHGCVWNGKWTCIFTSDPDHSFGIAESNDPEGAPGSWRKFDGSGFNSPGLGGGYSAIRGVGRGTNPSIMWSNVLEKYIMAFGTWENNIHIAASSDLINWEGERTLITPTFGARAWYPSLISPDAGSYRANGNEVHIYYADGLSPGGDGRVLTKQVMSISRND